VLAWLNPANIRGTKPEGEFFFNKLIKIWISHWAQAALRSSARLPATKEKKTIFILFIFFGFPPGHRRPRYAPRGRVRPKNKKLNKIIFIYWFSSWAPVAWWSSARSLATSQKITIIK
jgi:hypothetical protein